MELLVLSFIFLKVVVREIEPALGVKVLFFHVNPVIEIIHQNFTIARSLCNSYREAFFLTEWIEFLGWSASSRICRLIAQCRECRIKCQFDRQLRRAVLSIQCNLYKEGVTRVHWFLLQNSIIKSPYILFFIYSWLSILVCITIKKVHFFSEIVIVKW